MSDCLNEDAIFIKGNINNFFRTIDQRNVKKLPYIIELVSLSNIVLHKYCLYCHKNNIQSSTMTMSGGAALVVIMRLYD